MSHVGIPMEDQPPTPQRGSRQRGKGAPAAFLSLLLLGGIGAAVVLGGLFLWNQFGPNSAEDYPGPGSGSVVVVVAEGDTVTDIGNTLAEADVVASTEAFVDVTKGDERANTIAPGAYEMMQQMSGQGAFELILDPDSRYESDVVLPEGLRIDQTVQRTTEGTGIPEDALWSVLGDPAQGLVLPSWAPNTGDLRAEGFLFPATYGFAKDAAALPVLQAYVDRFDEAAATTKLAESQTRVGKSPYEVLTIASIVQVEVNPEDYGKAARVIYNRLDPDTWGDTAGFLGLDSTLNYANKASDASLSSEQLAQDGPYNTYTRQGLPPTPINSPGEEAINAALNPEEGDWLYWVTVNLDTGETKFSSNHDDFLQDKQEFQDWCSANPGKC